MHLTEDNQSSAGNQAPVNDNRCWYAIYTRSRAEKKVHADLVSLGLEAYLPLQKRIRQWSDRKKLVEMPIISSYVFVKVLPASRDLVFRSPHVSRFVFFNGQPAVIPENQIERLKQLINAEVPVESTLREFKPGEPVKIIYGPLNGLQGEFVKVGSEKRFLVRAENLGFSLLVTVPAAWVEKREAAESEKRKVQSSKGKAQG